MVAGTWTGHGGHPDLKNGCHASVEPHHGGRRPARHAVDEPTPSRAARGLRTCASRRPRRYGLQTRVRLPPIQQVRGLCLRGLCLPQAGLSSFATTHGSSREEHLVDHSDVVIGIDPTSAPAPPPRWTAPGVSCRSPAWPPPGTAIGRCARGLAAGRPARSPSRAPAAWAGQSPSSCWVRARPSSMSRPSWLPGSGCCHPGTTARPKPQDRPRRRHRHRPGRPARHRPAAGRR
jgi:hypothetical protein